MPITVGAIRKQRADRRKTAMNLTTKDGYKKALSAMRKKPTAKNLTAAFSQLDRASKKHVIHKNTAARLKSRLSSLLPKKK